ncbi:D-aminoacyl-tRNA deacylase [Kiritimatiellaeota bacterium B1221]|nr:D-aminoacyl-tRNA deacylase [Kiritimatiellaeota bacterium B1221]
MKIVLQRVQEARVEVDSQVVGRIGRGFLLLVGVGREDTPADAQWLARKIAGLRIFPDTDGRMNLSLSEVEGACLAVSQFTLFGDCKKGFRPGFTSAAPAEKGKADFEAFVAYLRGEGVAVETGIFQADMQVHLLNDGPVTLILEREAGQ